MKNRLVKLAVRVMIFSGMIARQLGGLIALQVWCALLLAGCATPYQKIGTDASGGSPSCAQGIG